MNTTGKRIIQRTLAILIIFIMTMADWSIIGMNLISFAVGEPETSNENITLNAYFNQETKSKEITKQIDANDLKLIIELGVKNDGYLKNAKLELGENANFKFKTNLADSHIKTITETEIQLNQINEGDEVKLQVGIEFANKEQMPIDYFSKESDINLTGSYINSQNVNNGQGVEITGTAKVQITWQSKQDTASALQTQILTNSIYKVEETNKRIIQILIKSNIVNNSYPVKNTNIKVNLPSEPESVEAHARTLDATNGSNEFTKTYANKELTISATNNKDNKITWKKGVQDEYIVTLTYPQNAEVANQTINIESTLTTYDEKQLQKTSQVTINNDVDGIATVNQKEVQAQISKGKIYTGDSKTYKTKTQLNIDYAKSIEQIVLEEQTPRFIKQEEEKVANIEYAKTTIDKNEFLSIFGEEGSIQILDQQGNEAETITKDTGANEQGKIIIEYTPDTTSLEITTTKPVAEGVLTIEHEKKILETEYTRAELQQITKIKDKNKITYTKTGNTNKTNTSEAILNLKETESEVSFNIDKTTLGDAQEQEINMQVILKANSEDRDLFKNPEIKITMPEKIRVKSSNLNILYLNGLQLENGNFKVEKENNKDVIKTKLTGEQSSYPGNAIEGTQINIKAVLQINELEQDIADKIRLTYTNENATKFADNGTHEANIQLIAQPKQTEEQQQGQQQTGAIINANCIAEVGGKALQTDEEIKAGEIITYNVEISNKGTSKAENISILATIPENTTLIEINPNYLANDEDGVEISENEEDEPYFIERQTTQISKSNISVEAGKTTTYTYMVKVNTNITETKEIQSQITVKHNEEQIKSEILKNKIAKASLEVELMPILRTGKTKIKAQQSYIYRLNIYNLSNEEQKNVEVTINKNDLIKILNIDYAKYEEGDEEEDDEEDGDDEEEHYVEIEGETRTFKIDSIPAQSMIGAEIDALINNPTDKLTTADLSITVKNSKGESYRSIELSEEVEAAKISATLTANIPSKTKYLNPGQEITYTIKIKNTGDTDLEDLTIEDRFSDFLELQKITLNGKTVEYDEIPEFEEDVTYNTIEIATSLKKGEEATLQITGKLNEEIYVEEDEAVINKALIYETHLLAETEQIEHFIKATEFDDEDYPDENEDENENKNENEDSETNNTISGTAWLDANNNGARDSEETLIEGVKVYAIDVSTNQIAENNNGTEISAITNSDGVYKLNDLPEGEYIVAFEYDTQQYMVTTYQAEGVTSNKNSDAVKVSRTVNGEEKIIAITDSLDVTENISNIDIGLIEAKVFDLDLEKVVSKIIITNSEGTKTYNFKDTNLAKTEIRAKNLSGSNVVIEYKMKISNKGEIPGYAKSIVDYMPASLKFNSSINKDWYQKDGYLYNDSLADTIIEPGETKEIKLVLTKNMTESNTGLTNNRAEIAESYNELGIEDIDSTSEGTEEKQAISSADVIITPSTGAAVSYVTLTLTILAIIGGIAYLIDKKLLIKNIKI